MSSKVKESKQSDHWKLLVWHGALWFLVLFNGIINGSEMAFPSTCDLGFNFGTLFWIVFSLVMHLFLHMFLVYGYLLFVNAGIPLKQRDWFSLWFIFLIRYSNNWPVTGIHVLTSLMRCWQNVFFSAFGVLGLFIAGFKVLDKASREPLPQLSDFTQLFRSFGDGVLLQGSNWKVVFLGLWWWCGLSVMYMSLSIMAVIWPRMLGQAGVKFSFCLFAYSGLDHFANA